VHKTQIYGASELARAELGSEFLGRRARVAGQVGGLLHLGEREDFYSFGDFGGEGEEGGVEGSAEGRGD
jgi:hypothetical protein